MPVDMPIYLVAQRKKGVQFDGKIPPFGIMCVGKALGDAGYSVKIFHLVGEEGEKILEGAVREERPLFVGFSNCVSSTIRHDIRLSRRLHDQGVKVVWGGVFATAAPDTALYSGYVDYVVVGDGERPAVSLAQAIENRAEPAGIPGVGYRDGEEIVIQPPSPVEPNLDNYPMGMDLIDWEDYIFPDKSSEVIITSLNLSRGCPFGCSFCTNSMNPDRRLWRGYSNDYVREMVSFLKDKYKISAVHLQDDNPFGKLKAGMEQIENLGLKWISAAHLQDATPEFLDWAKDCGCLNLSFGIESGSERILKKMNKRIDSETIRERMRLCGETGLQSWGMWMAFVPGETVEDRRLTFSLMDEIYESNPIVQMHISIYKAFPGTPFWEESLKLGLKEPQTLEEWADYKGTINHLLGYNDRKIKRIWRNLRPLYYYEHQRNKLNPLLRSLLRRRLQGARFRGPLEEGLHYARVARDAVKKIF